MKRFIYIVQLFILLFVNLKALEYKPFKVTYYDNPSPGYLFLTPQVSQVFYLTDNTGEPVCINKMQYFDDFINPKIQPNGLISFYSGTKYYLMNDNYEIVDSFSCEGDYEVDFHDFILLSNGNIAMLGRDKRMMDLSKTVPGGQTNALVIGSIIQEFDKNKNLVFYWNSFDHFQITDVTSDIDLTQSAIISCHMNSIFYDTDGNIIASSRDIDEITKIDRNTGNIIWRLGGKGCKNNQFSFLNDSIDGFFGFSHQHSVTKLPNGNLLLFDNGDLRPNPYSRAVEYKIDEENKKIEKVWEYFENPKINTYSMGNVQRLQNGNTIIGWGINSGNKTATEVKPDGTKALEIVGYQNYAVYKYIYKMHAVTLFANQPGVYNFNEDTNQTDVKIIINNLVGESLISVEEHFHQPHNLAFTGKEPIEISDNRWVLSLDRIKDINAKIQFFISAFSASDYNNYFIYYRLKEGTGSFSPLNTTYNKNDGCFEADITGSGEFIIGFIPSIMAPIAIEPHDSSTEVDILTKIIWEPMSVSSEYRFQLSVEPDFSDLIIDSSNIKDTWLDVNLDYHTTYYWRVKAFYAEEQSLWSNVWMFTTKSETSVNNKNINEKNLKIYYSDDGKPAFIFGNCTTGAYHFGLFDIRGNMIVESNGYFFGDGGEQIILVKENLRSGLYIYQILSGYQFFTGKIII